jgi:uncharacterized membrane protein
MADNPRWAPWVTLPLTVAGLGVSSYLTYVHYTEPTQLTCPDTGVINCTKVTTSSWSMVGPVPVAVLGLVFFVAMAVLCLPAAWRSSDPRITRARLAGAVAGVVGVVYLVAAEVLALHAICLWCTAVHVISFLLFVAVLAAYLHVPDEDVLDDATDDARSSAPIR